MLFALPLKSGVLEQFCFRQSRHDKILHDMTHYVIIVGLPRGRVTGTGWPEYRWGGGGGGGPLKEFAYVDFATCPRLSFVKVSDRPPPCSPEPSLGMMKDLEQQARPRGAQGGSARGFGYCQKVLFGFFFFFGGGRGAGPAVAACSMSTGGASLLLQPPPPFIIKRLSADDFRSKGLCAVGQGTGKLSHLNRRGTFWCIRCFIQSSTVLLSP